MPKYIYRMPSSDDELQHFDISDIGKGLSAAGKAIGDTFASLTGQKKNKSGKTVKKSDKKDSKVKVKAKGAKKSEKKRTGKYKGGKKDREWKNHKYGERHRNKDGKWVYDIDGVDRDKLGSLGAAQNNQFTTRRKDGKKNVEWKEFPLLAKILEPATYLKDLTDGKVIEAGTKFMGYLKEGANQLAALGRQFGSKTDDTGLPLKDGAEADDTKEDDLRLANPGYSNKDGGSQSNCPACSMAYEMRRRGYEVTARESDQGLPGDQLASFFKDPEVYNVQPAYDNVYIDWQKGEYVNEGLSAAVQDQMSREEDGSRGVAWVNWYPQGSGGHIFNYEVENGEVVIYDGQPGEKHKLSDYSNKAATWDYYRTDNLEPNIDEIKKVIK